MELLQTLANTRNRESERLRHIGGFLMTYGSQCRVVLSADLPDGEKERGLKHLLVRLADTPIGETGMYLWSATDN
jgi:hypothetical protein